MILTRAEHPGLVRSPAFKRNTLRALARAVDRLKPVLRTNAWRVAALAVLLAGCGDGAKNAAAGAAPGAPPAAGDEGDPAPEAMPNPDDFKFTVTAPEKAELGGDLVFKVRVENRGAVPAKVNVPRLGRDSVVFKVRGDKLDVAWLDPIVQKFTTRGFEPSPAEVREIGKDQAVESEIRVAAVLCGKLVFTPLYSCQALGAMLSADAVKVEVVPAPGGSQAGLRFETSHGTIDMKLRSDIAFQTCTLNATLARKGFYDGLKFHRIIQGFMAQGGCPEGQGWGGPGYTMRRELHGKLPHRRGVFSMARQQAFDTAGSQFFIMFGERQDLDVGGYTTFGEMVAGEDALKRIESVGAPPMINGPDAPREPVTIKKATLFVLP